MFWNCLGAWWFELFFSSWDDGCLGTSFSDWSMERILARSAPRRAPWVPGIWKGFEEGPDAASCPSSFRFIDSTLLSIRILFCKQWEYHVASKRGPFGEDFLHLFDIYIYMCIHIVRAAPNSQPDSWGPPVPTHGCDTGADAKPATRCFPGNDIFTWQGETVLLLCAWLLYKRQDSATLDEVFSVCNVWIRDASYCNSYCNTFFWCSPSIHAPTQPRMSLFAVGWVFLHDSCNARDPRAKASWKLVRWVSNFFFGVYQTQQDWRIGSCSKYSFIDKLDEESSLVVSFFPLIFRSRTMPPCCSSGSSPEFLAVPLSPAPHRQGW